MSSIVAVIRSACRLGGWEPPVRGYRYRVFYFAVIRLACRLGGWEPPVRGYLCRVFYFAVMRSACRHGDLLIAAIDVTAAAYSILR